MLPLENGIVQLPKRWWKTKRRADDVHARRAGHQTFPKHDVKQSRKASHQPIAWPGSWRLHLLAAALWENSLIDVTPHGTCSNLGATEFSCLFSAKVNSISSACESMLPFAPEPPNPAMLAHSVNSYADATIDPRLLNGILSLSRSEKNPLTNVENGRRNETARVSPVQWNHAIMQPLEGFDPIPNALHVAESLGKGEEVRNAVPAFISRALNLTKRVDARFVSARREFNQLPDFTSQSAFVFATQHPVPPRYSPHLQIRKIAYWRE